jgi:hypothetical protein
VVILELGLHVKGISDRAELCDVYHGKSIVLVRSRSVNAVDEDGSDLYDWHARCTDPDDWRTLLVRGTWRSAMERDQFELLMFLAKIRHVEEDARLAREEQEKARL